MSVMRRSIANLQLGIPRATTWALHFSNSSILLYRRAASVSTKALSMGDATIWLLKSLSSSKSARRTISSAAVTQCCPFSGKVPSNSSPYLYSPAEGAGAMTLCTSAKLLSSPLSTLASTSLIAAVRRMSTRWLFQTSKATPVILSSWVPSSLLATPISQ